MWRTLNILSLDVAAGAVVGCAFFSNLLGVAPLPHAFIILGLTVWIIYTTDHLVDAWQITRQGAEAASERHRYHQRHFTPLLLLVVVASFVVGMEVFFIRKPVLISGAVLATCVVGYLLFQRHLKIAKEAAGALLYTVGVILAPSSLLGRAMNGYEIGLVAAFGLTAFVNLLLFSLFDRRGDLRDNHPSLAVAIGEKGTRRLLLIILCLVVILCLWLIGASPYPGPAVVVVVMNGFLLLIFSATNFFAVHDRYRRLGDSIFLLPLLYLVFFA